MNYPENFYRGISDPNSVNEYKEIGPGVFSFPKQESDKRPDGYFELSINWDDDENALELLKIQCKNNNQLQFKGGYCKVHLVTVIQWLELCYDKKVFSYERCPTPINTLQGQVDNPYHGNLLLHHTASKFTRDNIQHALSMQAQYIERQ